MMCSKGLTSLASTSSPPSPLALPSFLFVFNVGDVALLIATHLGVSSLLRLGSASQQLEEAAGVDCIWQPLALAWLPPALRAYVREPVDLLVATFGNSTHKCFPEALSVVRRPCGNLSWRQALLAGPAFVMRPVSGRLVVCQFGLGLCVLDSTVIPGFVPESCDACACANVRASSGILYWEVCFAKLAPTAVRRANASPLPSAWVGVVHDPTRPLASADSSDGFCYYSGGTFISANRAVLKAGEARYGAGDAVGVLLDCERREVTFFLNSKLLGTVFSNVPLPLTPAIQIETAQECHLSVRCPRVLTRAEVNAAMAHRPAILAVPSHSMGDVPIAAAFSRVGKDVGNNDNRLSGLLAVAAAAPGADQTGDTEWLGHELVW
eukprot:TRINITY_DN62248_c0_g1_i1.p1 TRINITY_DN62248_c0_g1~~TRINITY_DN62248_c0_g1_i1.p1  ORF type:complete len:380 (+),score=42.65 TRINITY_DN62248_c0_g1_i1:40-1179(+)